MATTRKRKVKKVAIVEQPFTVGVPEELPSPVPEERPELSEETIGGLLALRDHLSLRVPQLLWPLRSLPSMTQHLSDLDSAGEAVDSLAIRHAMTPDKLAELRRFLLEDAYAWTYLICRHRDIVPEAHMAMCYASAGQAGKLAWLITQSGFEGFVIDQFRNACASRGIDPSTIDGVYKLDAALDWQNQRWPRHWFKSSVISHGVTMLDATRDPDSSILIVCAKEDKAHSIVEQCGKTIQSGIYRDLFPERVPDKARDISKSEITVNGRTVSSREKTIQGTSYITREISGHYDIVDTDDIVIRDVRGGIIGGGPGGPAIRWLTGMTGMRNPTRRWRRRHNGTINSTVDDDHAWLTYGKRSARVLSIVVPAEIYPNGEFPESVLVRGTPTVPEFFPEASIIEALEEMVADETEADGIEAFRSDFWLAPTPSKSRLFSEDLLNPSRAWMGPYEHPALRTKGGEKYKNQFLVARMERTPEGCPIDNARKPLDVRLESWRKRALLAVWNPWEDMDRVMVVNLAWMRGAKSWAITAAAADPALVRYQLETRTGDDIGAPLVNALAEMDALYKPRVIGIEAKAWSDHTVRNRFATDPKLRTLERRVVGIDTTQATEEARIRTGIAEPLSSYQWLLLPTPPGSLGDFGAAATRAELARYRAGAETPWPITETLAGVSAIVKRVATPQQRTEARKLRVQRESAYRASLGEFGVPSAA